MKTKSFIEIIERVLNDGSKTMKEAISTAEYQAGVQLFREYADQLGVDLGFQNFDAELASIEHQYTRPEGVLFIIYDHNELPLGCFGIRKLEGRVCELKRMFLREEARGKGLGKDMLAKSVDLAKELGYAKMRLDTLPTMQAAIRLYRQFGFYEIDPYDIILLKELNIWKSNWRNNHWL